MNDKLKVFEDLKTKLPEDLMAEINQSIITKGMVISITIHLLVVGLTSFGLYADWVKYGFMLPYEIRVAKKQIADEARKEMLSAERQKKDADRLASAASEKRASAALKSEQGASADAATSTADTDTRSEYQKKVEAVSRDRPDAPVQDLDADLGLEE